MLTQSQVTTTIRPIDKKSCVRLVYKSPYSNATDLSYHIDLPVYGYKTNIWGETTIVIGFKGQEQWSEESNPDRFQSWFQGRCNLNRSDPQQLKRIIKYLKGWKDKNPNYPKLPDGMVLTVLAGKNYEPHSRDDISLFNTVLQFYNKIYWWFSVIKPVEPENNLVEDLSYTQKQNFKERISKMIDRMGKAIDEEDHVKSLKIWSTIFGDRF